MSQSDAYTGEISLFSYDFVPQEWLECNGQALSSTAYSALYSIIGTKFGGDPAQMTFNLPNLNHQAVMGVGQGPGLTMREDGSSCGAEYVALSDLQTGHSHSMINKGALNPATDKTSAPQNSSTIGAITILPPSGPATAANSMIAGGTSSALMHPKSIGPAGLRDPIPHDNSQPFLALRYCICVSGEYPTHD
ncbi:MAG: tail fiber protein [Sphingopyxis sp.]